MCVLHVSSKTDSFGDFLKEASLPFYRSWEKGEACALGKRAPHDDYGFSCAVSEKAWTDLAGQIEDAHAFLREHSDSLERLLTGHVLSDIRLDFPYSCRLDEETFMQCDYLPPEFLKLAGELGIGIELSHYHPSEEDN